MSAGLFSSEASVLGMQMTAFLLDPQMVLPPCLDTPSVSLCILISCSYNTGLGPTLIASLMALYSCSEEQEVKIEHMMGEG